MQHALRRVATMVADAAPPEEVFAAVAAEAGRMMEADFALMSRYESDGTARVVDCWAADGDNGFFPPGTMMEPHGHSVHNRVFATGRSVRYDGYPRDSGPGTATARHLGVRAVVGVPIHLEGRLWGLIGVASTKQDALPDDTEEWLAAFTELVAIAIDNARVREELRRFGEEQAALRRVATLVARAAPPEEVFTAVAAEVGLVLEGDFTALSRYDEGGTATFVGTWRRRGLDRRAVFRSVIDAPISVAGRHWGEISVASTRDEPLPSETETRLAAFTELVGTAVANAEAQAALTASRARLVSAADTARRRIERDLHDGAQQRLVSLALHLRTALTEVPAEAGELRNRLRGMADGLAAVLEELRSLAHGIHPAALAEGGLSSALNALVRRSAIPVKVGVDIGGRLPERVELAAYYVVAEALTNAAKHADAALIEVEVDLDEGGEALRVRIHDDGRGGADPGSGSGLVGIADRVESLGGTLVLDSPAGFGTTLEITLPLPAPTG